MPPHPQLSASLIVPSERLPLSLIALDDWALVTLSGHDSARYLQGQVTCDVTTLQHNGYLLGAQCNTKGKMWSCFHLFHLAEQLALLQRRSVCETAIKELQRYAIFSKVTIGQGEHYRLLGVAGDGARRALQTVFPQLPSAEAPCLAIDEGVMLYFSSPAERFLIVTPHAAAAFAPLLLQQGATWRPADQWLALDIAAGLPIIDTLNSDQLLPQAVNLDKLGGISFTKGCYLGQEGVARAQYRGTNKRANYWLCGESAQLPGIGDSLERPMGEQWRAGGRVLAAVRLADNTVWVQAVLTYPLASNTAIRVRHQPESWLQCQPLLWDHSP